MRPTFVLCTFSGIETRRGCTSATAPVKTHVSHLLTKLDCRDRAQLVMYAHESCDAVPGGA